MKLLSIPMWGRHSWRRGAFRRLSSPWKNRPKDYPLRVILLTIGAMAYAQSVPAFEVASIKPSSPDARGEMIQMPPGERIRITNMILKQLIVVAWHVQPFQVSGGPPWLESLHFDISAKAETARSS